MAARDAGLIEVWYSERSTRSKRLAERLAFGVKTIGRRAALYDEREYRGSGWSQMVVFYGLHGNLLKLYDDAIAQGRTVLFVDLGYWRRELPGYQRWYGYHRVSLNSRHPNPYFQAHRHPSDRFQALDLEVRYAVPYDERGDAVLVVGMSEKAAEVNGLAFQEYETRTAEALRKYTRRPIMYRPKPGAGRKPPPGIPGTIYVPKEEPLNATLAKTWCVVTRHSNVSVDALLRGLPAIVTDEGAAREICHSSLTMVDGPYMPDEQQRRQFFADLAYTQWTPDEFADGTFWRHMAEEGWI